LSEQGVVAHRAGTEDDALEPATAAGLDVLILEFGVPVARALEAYLAIQEAAPHVAAVIIARVHTNGK